MMQINNHVLAPMDFIDSIGAAVKMGEGFFSNRFNIVFTFNNVIDIEDEDHESESENQKRRMNIMILVKELNELHELLRIIFKQNQWDNLWLLESIIQLTEILMGEIDDDIWYLFKTIHREIEKILKDKITLEIDNEIIDRIRKITLSVKKRVEELRFPIDVMGRYYQKDGSIKLFYKTIKKASTGLKINEVGANVIVHELFHAAHFYEMSCINARPELRGELSHLRKDAVIETLAESACLEYAKTFQSPKTANFVRRCAKAHPLPYWGYYGALIIERHQPNYYYQDILFKSIYYASLLNTNYAYRLVFS